MITVKKNVYYCEFCKKRSLSASSTRKHESRCTANPDRECKMCKGHNIREIVEGYKKRFEIIEVMGEFAEQEEVKWIGTPVTVEDVRKKVGGCPNCMLAVIRQVGFNRYYFTEAFGTFDYKKEFSVAMENKNKEDEYADYMQSFR